MSERFDLARPVSARAVRTYRVATALLVAAWFIRTGYDAADYTAVDGLLDHSLSEQLFWFTWQPLFRPGMPGFWPHAVFATALALCGAVALDHRRRLAAGLLYLLVVCTYRWNFMVMYVDDVVVHLLLFWLLCLPDTRAPDGRALESVPGTVVRLAALNVTLLYLIAGLTKWRSGMWLDGSAVWAVMRQPYAFDPARMGDVPCSVARVANAAALVVEPLLALLPWLRPRSLSRRALLVAGVALHLGIALTLDIVFANLGCLVLLVLACHDEFPRVGVSAEGAAPSTRWPPGARVAALGLFLITGSTVSSALQVQWRRPPAERANTDAHFATAEAGEWWQALFSGGAWVMGLAQQYCLLDWIDERDGYIASQTAVAATPGAELQPARQLLPHTMRGALLRAYLSGMTWAPLPPAALRAWQQSSGERIARRACRETPDTTRREHTTIRRSGHPASPPVETLFSFRCRGREVEGLETRFADPAGGTP
ncbi:MAG: hypothetical protein EXR71_20565 [Myxococcales bacterium]|nr:hypothetical protein [Myxococcales bacterium]